MMTGGLKETPFVRLHLLTILIFAIIQDSTACSGYKITIGNKTILGSNEDAWRVTPKIWFENGKGNGRYGAAFTGSRFDGKTDTLHNPE